MSTWYSFTLCWRHVEGIAEFDRCLCDSLAVFCFFGAKPSHAFPFFNSLTCFKLCSRRNTSHGETPRRDGDCVCSGRSGGSATTTLSAESFPKIVQPCSEVVLGISMFLKCRKKASICFHRMNRFHNLLFPNWGFDQINRKCTHSEVVAELRVMCDTP